MAVSPKIYLLAAGSHIEAGNYREAVAVYEQGLRVYPDLALLHDGLGRTLQQLQEWPRAEQCHRRAILLQPDYAPAHDNLGSALRGQGKRMQAAAAFQNALRLQPNDAEIVYNLGAVLHEAGRPDRAAACYRRSLSLRPGSAPVVTALATALVEQGLLDEAITYFRVSLGIDPNQPLVYYYLSQFAAEGHCRLTTVEESHLRGLMAAKSHCSLERSQCAFALAAVHAGRGDYDGAFGLYQQANDVRKRLFEQQNSGFDARRHERFVDRIIARYDRAYFERVRTWGTNTELPMFIIGMPRSGSTLVEQILASHRQVYGAGELGDLAQLLAARAAEPGLPAMADSNEPALMLPNEQAARQVGADYVQGLAAAGQDERGPNAPPPSRAINKTLHNFLHLGLIATLFPKARVIHCRRQPLDVCLSCYFTNFRDVNFSWSLADIATYYRAYEKLMAHWSQVLPIPIHEVCYEELVRDQEPVTRKLLAACALDWDDQCLSFFKSRRSVRTASTLQIRKPISGHSVGRWQHYRSHLGPLLAALGRKDEAASAKPPILQPSFDDAPRPMAPQ